MQYRPLGRTGLQVSAIALGSVSLGVDYGIAAPGAFGRPGRDEALAVVRAAMDQGINLFDTAPAYGESERLLGEALARRPDCYVATKVPAAAGEVAGSLESSLRALRCDVLDIVQIHNASVEVLERGAVAGALMKAREQGKVRFLGASVYGEGAALAAVRAGCFDVLQVAYNALDRRMEAQVFPAARSAGVGIVARSAYLKGALTPKAQWLPPELAELRQAVERLREALGIGWEDLPAAALRFCLAADAVGSVLVGARTEAELSVATAAAQMGPLDAKGLAALRDVGLTDERLLNPSYWPVA